MFLLFPLFAEKLSIASDSSSAGDGNSDDEELIGPPLPPHMTLDPEEKGEMGPPLPPDYFEDNTSTTQGQLTSITK